MNTVVTRGVSKPCPGDHQGSEREREREAAVGSDAGGRPTGHHRLTREPHPGRNPHDPPPRYHHTKREGENKGSLVDGDDVATPATVHLLDTGTEPGQLERRERERLGSRTN